MNAFRFAVRSLFRQPGRAGLGILGIAAVGALLFDMLLLSRGLVVSFRDLLDRVGFDVRVSATEASALTGLPIVHASEVARQARALPEIADASPLRLLDGELIQADGRPLSVSVSGVDVGNRRPWTLAVGHDLEQTASGARPSLLLSSSLATRINRKPGDDVMLRPRCDDQRAAPAPLAFRVVGIADFPFDDEGQSSVAALRASFAIACDEVEKDLANLVLIASREGYGADAAVAALRKVRPDLLATTNEQVVSQMQDQGFTYFRQISTVLSTITMLFGFLLITVLLTVSVNQRIAEIAAIRALGFSRARVAADVLWQSVLLVGAGGVLAVPLGFALSLWLDEILKAMPGIPLTMHFFVFEPRAIVLHGGLLVVTAFLAAAYPMWLVASLPIAATLRNEVVS